MAGAWHGAPTSEAKVAVALRVVSRALSAGAAR
jgi:hypothetical protein